MSEQNVNPQFTEDEFQAAEDAVEIDFDIVEDEDDGSPLWEGEEGVVEPDPEPEAADTNPEEDTVEDDAVEDEDDPDGDEPEVRDWDHNVDSLPEETVVDGVRIPIKGLYQDMVRGYQKSNQRAVAAEKRAAERELQYKQLIDDIKAGNDDPRPADPTDDMSAGEQRQRWDDIQRWLYRDEARRTRINSAPAAPAHAAPQAPQYQLPEGVPDTPEARAQFEREVRVMQRDDYTDEIGNEMIAAMQTDPYWAAQAQTDDGIMKLFELTKERREAAALKAQLAEREKESIRRKAGARERATPSPANSRKSPSRSDVFARKIEKGERVTWADAEAAT